MKPLIFEKSAHNALWGTESWELSAFPTDPSRVAMDSLFPNFPLLFKVIDVRARLLVQVHPNEETCKVTGGNPNTEMWCAPSDMTAPNLLNADLKAGENEIMALVANPYYLLEPLANAGDPLHVAATLSGDEFSCIDPGGNPELKTDEPSISDDLSEGI